MQNGEFNEPVSMKRRRIEQEEEKSEPNVVIKSHLKRKGVDGSGAETASEWDEKESQTSLGTLNKKGQTITRSLRSSAKWDTPRRTAS